MFIDEQEELARLIPTMTDIENRRALRKAASEVPLNTNIVEIGAWLGACTSYMAMGIMDAKKHEHIQLHVYDRFKASESEIKKAEAFGCILYPGESTKYAFENYLKPWPKVEIYKHVGDIKLSRWIRRPISLYVDDATKRQDKFLHCLRIFQPFFIPNVTMLYMMDYFYYEKKTGDEGLLFQKQYFEKRKDQFEYVGRITEGASPAVFKYLGGQFDERRK